MSIRRIESAYATYFDDKRLSGPEMAVLIALSYVANEKRNEDCFPSDRYLEQLTHFKNSTVRNARNKLKSLKIIDWESGGLRRAGGNISNRYTFLFPHKAMLSKRDRYQPLAPTAQGIQPPAPPDTVTTPFDTVPTPFDTVPTPFDTVPTPFDTIPSVATSPTLRYETPTNTEITPKKTSEPKSEPTVVCSSGVFEDLFVRKAPFGKTNSLSKYPILVQMALKACGVTDEHNANSFRSVINKLEPNWVDEEILAFESEIRQGEHDNAENLAAVLMQRLKNGLKR